MSMDNNQLNVGSDIWKTIIDKLSFTEIYNLWRTSPYVASIVENLTTRIIINIKLKNKNTLLDRINHLYNVEHICNFLLKFKNLKKLKIENFDFIKDEVSLYKLFHTISQFNKLIELSICFKFRLKINSLSVFYNLINFNSFSNLKVLKIPNIQLDLYTQNPIKDFGELFVLKFIRKLINIENFHINLKNKYHHLYIDNLNKNTLKTLHISSKNTNIFNQFYTVYDKQSGKYVVSKYISFPNLTKLYLNLNLSEVKAALYTLDPITKNSIQYLFIDLGIVGGNSNNLVYKSLFYKINCLSNLENLVFLNVPTYLECSDCFYYLIRNKIKYLTIDSRLNTIRGPNIDILKLVFDNIFQLKNLKCLILNLKRGKLKFNTLRTLGKSIDNFIQHNQTLEYLIIYNVDIFHYLYLFLSTFPGITTLKGIIIFNSHLTLFTKTTYQSRFYRIINKIQKRSIHLYAPSIITELSEKPNSDKIVNLLKDLKQKSLDNQFISTINSGHIIPIAKLSKIVSVFPFGASL